MGRETPELREEVQGAADEETNIEYLSPSRQIETLNQTPPPAYISAEIDKVHVEDLDKLIEEYEQTDIDQIIDDVERLDNKIKNQSLYEKQLDEEFGSNHLGSMIFESSKGKYESQQNRLKSINDL